MKKNFEDTDFKLILKGKKTPILTLDERWYELFPDYDKPDYIKNIEERLNQLIKRQGKLHSDLKDLKNLKKNLMKEIITHMDVDDTKVGKLNARKLDKNQKLIKEISQRMINTEDEIMDIPYQIKAVNEELVIECVKLCYQRLNMNNKKIDEISIWINQVRQELKEKILIKQDMEIKNNLMYSYMHDLLGPEILQGFDESINKG